MTLPQVPVLQELGEDPEFQRVINTQQGRKKRPPLPGTRGGGTNVSLLIIIIFIIIIIFSFVLVQEWVRSDHPLDTLP